MFFDEDAYAEGICNSAAGSTIEVFVDTIDGTVGSLRELVQKLPNNEEARDYVFECIDRWEALRKAIVAIEQGNEEGTTFAAEELDRDHTAAELYSLDAGEEWEHPTNGKIVTRITAKADGGDLWRVMDDGDNYNFYTLDDVLDEIGV